ncbi:amidohydrolase family protein [Kaistia dalseonensis]|uniref:Aminocarboxymuconate-semialdehyde decarboxylase n=1 Tax=Kaistia dalseonensis TaxID=410840 RepID=A0ABU0H1R6_9HYPH|nr:amidohydrolase family protein [Kaistia dalseonensis]MCX5493683.1 amidohydrolase family protein [Kaistia dalseonensis]MDQ0436246.1 aminocarboxymuconate-semialdehyde decarboxylase [Kaistia dalseonensis]
MTSTDWLDIVDFHTHLWPAHWAAADGSGHQPGFGFSDDIRRRITSPSALIDEALAGGVSLSVISATIESRFGTEAPVDAAEVSRTNDYLAGLVQAHPDHLAALAVVDVFSGEAGAREAERAVGELGLSGIVIDSSRHGVFPGDASARPTLEVAARLKVPVFVHPNNTPGRESLIAGAGALGNSLGRGLMNGVAFLSLLQSGLLDELPDLHLVFATLGLGAIVQASRGGKYGREARAAGLRPNIYFDTMGHDPAIIRTLTGFFGAERVLAGTDWPILPALSRPTLTASLTEASLDAEAQALIAGANARRLLALRTPG